jgi:hypothetical protein
VRFRIVFLFACLLGFCCAEAQIAFVRHDRLYVLPCESTGLPKPRSKPFLVCRLWNLYDLDRVSVTWTRSGQIAVAHDVDVPNGPRRFGLTGTDQACGIWLVDPTPHAKKRRLVSGSEPSFSPDGRFMAYQTGEYPRFDLWLLDLRTKQSKLLAKDANELIWSPKGDQVAYVQEEDMNDFAQPIVVRSYPGWRLVERMEPGVNPGVIIFSPDGKKLVVEHHLSRPLTGNEIVTIGGQVKHVEAAWSPDKYAPPMITDWSGKGDWLVSDWRIQNPDNDGTWTRCYIGLSSTAGPRGKNLGLGSDGRFSADGQHVLYLTDHKTGCFWKSSDLVCKPISGGHAVVLARSVDQFAINTH